MKSMGTLGRGARLERMQASPLWSGNGFRNKHPVLPNLRDPHAQMPSIRDFIRGTPRQIPKAPLPVQSPLEAWRTPPSSGLRVTWLSHSTILIEIDGVRVLTDPVWGLRAFPVQFFGPKRFQPMPVEINELPPIDVIAISQDHYDHLDYGTIRKLAKTNIPFVTSLGVGAHLELWGVHPARITELDWWESYRLPRGDLAITATPSQHFSGRKFSTRNSTLWSSFVIQSQRHSVFFSGDTGLTAEFQTVRQKFGAFDLVMLEIGAFHSAWGDIHLGPDFAMQAHAFLGGAAFMPIHWATFPLGLHAWDEPAERLLELTAKQQTPLLMPHMGEPVEPAHANKVFPWWRTVEVSALKEEREQRAQEPSFVSRLHWPMD